MFKYEVDWRKHLLEMFEGHGKLLAKLFKRQLDLKGAKQLRAIVKLLEQHHEFHEEGYRLSGRVRCPVFVIEDSLPDESGWAKAYRQATSEFHNANQHEIFYRKFRDFATYRWNDIEAKHAVFEAFMGGFMDEMKAVFDAFGRRIKWQEVVQGEPEE